MAFGVTKLPSVPTVTVPLDGPVATAQTLPPSPDGVSLVARLPVSGVSSTADRVSSAATGTSLTGVTVMSTVAETGVVPSLTV